MLSSILLSVAMSVSPAPVADTHSLDIKQVGDRRGSRRLNNDNTLGIETIGDRRGSRRLSNDNNLDIETVGDRRGSRRL